MMTQQQQRFEKALQKALRVMERRDSIKAVIGHPDGSLYVSGRDNYVYVQVSLPTGISVWEVLCTKVTPQLGLEVFIRRNRYDTWEVVEEDPFNASNFWGGTGVSGNVARHGSLHSWNASDPVIISARQLTEFRVAPSVDGSGVATLSVIVGPYLYRYNDTWAFLSQTTVDLTSEVPGVVYYHRLVVVGLNKSIGEATYVSGDAQFDYAEDNPFDGDDVATLLGEADDSFEPAGAVWLSTGQTKVEPVHIFLDCKGFERGGGASSSSASIWNVDNAPASPSAYDDEFNDSSFDTGLWTEFDTGAIQTLTESSTIISLSQSSQAGENLTGIYQSIPSGDFTIAVKVKSDVAAVSSDGQYLQGGIALFEDASGDNKAWLLGPVAYGSGGSTYNGFGAAYWASKTSVSYPATVYSSFAADTYYYLRLRRSGTNYYFDFSSDGETWTTSGLIPGFTPTHFGIGMANEATGSGVQIDGDFFRYRNVADTADDPVYGAADIGAPDDAQYLTLATNSTLTAERRLVAGDGLAGTDGGADGDYTLDVNVDDSTVEIATDTLQVKDGGITAAKMADGAALAEILDNDGAGSGLDADLLDGNHAAAFAAASHNHAASEITSGTLALARGGLAADVSAYEGLVKISGGATSEVKCNYAASAAPTAGDDSGDGYSVGSFWWDTTNDEAYVCLDASAGAAVWRRVGEATITVNNASGGAVVAGAVGYLDESGDFYTTTTAYFQAPWCVVVQGGASAADIKVLRRGRCTVTLDANCSAGDYLYTSTTAGQATPNSVLRPEVLAVALTTNASGAGGTCEALLLTGRVVIGASSSSYVYAVDAQTLSDFVATISSIAGSDVVYNAPTSGNEDALAAYTSIGSMGGKLVLHNTTRSDNALIESVDTSTNTITLTAAVPGTWTATDSITLRSQTVTGYHLGGAYMVDIDLSTWTELPDLAVGIEVETGITDSGGSGGTILFHPFEAYSLAKVGARRTQVAGVALNMPVIWSLIDSTISIIWRGTGSNTLRNVMRLSRWIVATP